MKKALIIANMLFASANILGMIPQDQNDNFENKRKIFRIEESPRENLQSKKKSRKLSNFFPKQITIWDVRNSKISCPSNISDESLLSFRRSILNLNPYVTTSTVRNFIEEFRIASLTRDSIQTIKSTDIYILKLGGKFPNLRELQIDVSDLKDISLEYLSFPALETLKIEEEERDKIGAKAKIGHLISKCSATLKKFDISNTNIDNVPQEIADCKKLIYLDCSHTNIRNLPANIENCKNLQYLNISDNFIEDIPDEVFGFEKLKHLEFQQTTEVYELSSDISPKISNLANLEYLAITGNFALKTLPPQLGHLKNLKTLIVEGNGLESLPKEIGKLENLKHLDLSSCEFKTLPAEIGKLENLDLLYISNNDRLESIPPEIWNLFKGKLKSTDKKLCNFALRYLLIYKNKTAMNDNDLKKFVEQNQKEEEMLKERRNNLKSSLDDFRSYTDADNESVFGSELDYESTSDSSEE